MPAAVGALVLSHMLVLYPTLSANSGWLGPVATRFRATNKDVWLTIDDGPDPIDTPQLLEVLESHGAKATFFVKGLYAEKYPELLREILAAGHSLANHSYHHPSASFWCLSRSAIREEIDDCNRVLTQVTGQKPVLFRAPVGMKNPFVHPLLAQRGMTLVGWSARGFDTVARSPKAVVDRIIKSVRPGSIILLHEGHRIGGERSPVVMARLLQALGADGYRCVLPRQKDLLS